MDSHHFIFISAAIFLSLTLNFPSKSDATAELSKHPNKLLMQVCNQSAEYGFCMHLMRTKPRILSAKSIRTVANFALAITRKRSIITRNLFNRLSTVAKNPGTREAFKECGDYLNGTVAMLNLNGLEGGTASLDVHYALDNVEYCVNVLRDAKVVSPKISGAIDDWKKYYHVAYATVLILEDETPAGA